MVIQIVDAANEFLSALKGITDPEEKRKVIGKTFIDIFEREFIPAAHRKKKSGRKEGLI